jgi:lipoate-protein ligase A
MALLNLGHAMRGRISLTQLQPLYPRLRHSTAFTQTRRYTQHLSRPLQIYRSTSTDPYLNLSIEHHLLQRSHPDSTILFLYTNRPSVVIGRNQNPWLEVNLHLLRQGLPPVSDADDDTEPEPVALVRRRSGGGTVFHDAGNANWTVICPPPAFDRDRHAEMVVRALRALGVRAARVNERHDIVVDVDGGADGGAGGTFKVSGSAYKLTRTRSLHHGTCLLRSANLGRVGKLLRSPAEGLIKARGVESVRSPIRNVGLGGEEFADAVVAEFRCMYGDEAGEAVVVGEKEALANEGVVKGVRELASPEWIFGQTPQFTFSTHPTEDDPRERPELAQSLAYDVSTVQVRSPA